MAPTLSPGARCLALGAPRLPGSRSTGIQPVSPDFRHVDTRDYAYACGKYVLRMYNTRGTLTAAGSSRHLHAEADS